MRLRHGEGAAVLRIVTLYVRGHYIAHGIIDIPGGDALGIFADAEAGRVIGIGGDNGRVRYGKYFTIDAPGDTGDARLPVIDKIAYWVIMIVQRGLGFDIFIACTGRSKIRYT